MKRREFVGDGAALLALGVMPHAMRERDASPEPPLAPKTYLIAADSWLGGWFYEPLAQRLRLLGHRVLTPTNTGLGERRHLLTRDITLDTFITDVASVMECEELRDVILVGHGSGGATITGVADRMPEQIRHVVFLDALLAANGQSLFDLVPPAVRGEREQAATDRFDGLAFPPPAEWDAMGVSRGPISSWMQRRATPHPLGAWESPLRISHPVGNRRPCTYVGFTAPALPFIDASRKLARTQPNWKWIEFSAGHDAPATVPDEVAKVLAAIM